jgi:hypothetical protein
VRDIAEDDERHPAAPDEPLEGERVPPSPIPASASEDARPEHRDEPSLGRSVVARLQGARLAQYVPLIRTSWRRRAPAER